MKKGVALDATFTIDHDDNVQDLINLAQQCQKFGDNCLELAQQQNITKPNFSVDYDLVVSEFANSQTFPASDTVTAEMLERTNWKVTKSELENANN